MTQKATLHDAEGRKFLTPAPNACVKKSRQSQPHSKQARLG